MKTLIKSIAVHALSLFVTTQLVSGFRIEGGITTLVLAAFVLVLMHMLIRPVLSIITFPLSIVTFGLSSFLVNAVILYLLTVFVSQVSIRPFRFDGISFAGFIIPPVQFNELFAILAVSVVLSFIIGAIQWVTKK